MPQYSDLYFLINKRSASFNKTFLDLFAPDRLPTNDVYYTNNDLKKEEVGFASPEEIMNYLDQHLFISYQIYWDVVNSYDLIKQIHVFYTDDGRTILGVGIPSRTIEEQKVLICYNKIKAYLNPLSSCITMEEMCPLNSKDFKSFCKERYH